MTRECDDPRLGEAPLGGEPAEGRGAGEHDHADRHHAPVTNDVGQPAAEREQRGQGQQVGVDRPLHPGAAQAEFLLDLRDGDGHDGLVDEGHRDREDHRCEDQVLQPAPVALA
jgi:hypothetical protein